MNLPIGDSAHEQVITIQKRRSLSIFPNGFFFPVVLTVQFNHQFSPCTVKIRNEFSEHFLPAKANRVIPQIIIPKMPFFLGHVFAQFFCKWHYILVVFSFHDTSPPFAGCIFGSPVRCIFGSPVQGELAWNTPEGLFFISVTIPPSRSARHLPLHKGGKDRLRTAAD